MKKACFLIILLCSYSNVEAGESEELLKRTDYLADQVFSLLSFYNDVYYCEKIECLDKLKKEHNKKFEWDEHNFGMLNVLKELREHFLENTIKDIEKDINNQPDNDELKTALEKYKKEYERLSNTPYYD